MGLCDGFMAVMPVSRKVRDGMLIMISIYDHWDCTFV